MALSAYIHIPFCSHKCDFCDFAAFAGVDELAQQYCQVVCQEIEDRRAISPNSAALTSVFYGGGTPGYIDPALIGDIHRTLQSHAGLAVDPEITLETTPHAITHEKARAWLALGINRLSIGVESLSDLELSALGRDHSRKDALAGMQAARQAGFTNLSIDLMYGIPKQTLSSFTQTLEKVMELAPEHLSAYGLQIAPGSRLLSRYPINGDSYPSEDEFTSLYERLIEITGAHDYHQYEISNFARPGFQSRHNLTYWKNQEYLAFGVSAHRLLNGVRSSNWRSLKRYLNDHLGLETEEKIDHSTRVREAIFLSLRTRQGLKFSEFLNTHGVDLKRLHASAIDKLADGGFLELSEDQMTLSQKGILVSNLVMSEFM